ncbi:MAG: hypothetical protein NTY34_02650 [Candidatus Omnitrophica bacterium]|nr:hypothetical protein [Candidatus Omnitrophota bacterium]
MNITIGGIIQKKANGPDGASVIIDPDDIAQACADSGVSVGRNAVSFILEELTKGERPLVRVLENGQYQVIPKTLDGEKSGSFRDKYGISAEMADKWAGLLDREVESVRQGESPSFPSSFALSRIMGSVIKQMPKGYCLGGFGFNITEPNISKRQFRMPAAGVPQAIVETNFLRIRSKRVKRYDADGIFTAADAVVPFYGDFYKPDGSRVSDEELAGIGLEWVKDGNGNRITYPFFATKFLPSRILTLPALGESLTVVLDNGKMHMITTIEEFEDFISSRFGKEPLAGIRRGAERQVEDALSKKYSPSSYIYQESLRRAYFILMKSFLQKKNIKTARMNIAAIRYKGFGADYVCQIADGEDLALNGLPGSQEFRNRWGSPDAKKMGFEIVSDNKFEGKSGIFLTPYQQSNIAIGGASKEEVTAKERDRLLIDNGALLSVITIDTVEIADRQQLDRIGAAAGLKELTGSISVVIDDTRSLSDIIMGGTIMYNNFLEEIDRDTVKAKDAHMTIFCSTLAQNIAACLKSGLTIPAGDVGLSSSTGFVRNVSPWGFIRDTGDLVDIIGLEDASLIIRSALYGGITLANKWGMSKKDFMGSNYFGILTKRMIRGLGSDKQRSEAAFRNIDTFIKIAKTAKEGAELDFALDRIISIISGYWADVSKREFSHGQASPHASAIDLPAEQPPAADSSAAQDEEIASSFDKSSGRSPEQCRGASSPSAPRNDGSEARPQPDKPAMAPESAVSVDTESIGDLRTLASMNASPQIIIDLDGSNIRSGGGLALLEAARRILVSPAARETMAGIMKAYSERYPDDRFSEERFNEIIRSVDAPRAPESALDLLPEQQDLAKSGKPLEFTEGILYHGMNGLDEFILSNMLSGEILLGRGPYYEALYAFHKEDANHPAILLFSTNLFNRLAREGMAELRIPGKIDPYPAITSPVSLDAVLEIWIDEDAGERYRNIMANPSSETEVALKPMLEGLFASGKIKIIPGFRRAAEKIYKDQQNAIARYMMERDLFAMIPAFKVAASPAAESFGPAQDTVPSVSRGTAQDGKIASSRLAVQSNRGGTHNDGSEAQARNDEVVTRPQPDKPAMAPESVNKAATLIQSLLDEMPADIKIDEGASRIQNHPQWSEIRNYLNSCENLITLTGNALWALPVIVETRASPMDLDKRAAMILADSHLTYIFNNLGHQIRYKWLLPRAVLASEDVHQAVKDFMKKPNGREVLMKKREGQAIAIFLAARRTREAAISFMAAMNPAEVHGYKGKKKLWLLSEESVMLSAFWYYLAPVYDELRKLDYSSQEAGERLVYLCEHFEEIYGKLHIFEYAYGWEDWLWEHDSTLKDCIEKDKLEGIIREITANTQPPAASPDAGDSRMTQNEQPLVVQGAAKDKSADTPDKLSGVLGVARDSEKPDNQNKDSDRAARRRRRRGFTRRHR